MAAIATHWRLLPNVSDMLSYNVWIMEFETGSSTLHQGGSQMQMRIPLELHELSCTDGEDGALLLQCGCSFLGLIP